MNRTAAARLASLDLLRLLAIGLVTLQHALSVTDHYNLTTVGPLSVGQQGVTLFCVISGFLAARDRRSASRWLALRLVRIYPPYWIVMAASFVITGVIHKKPFTAYQLLSQMAGTGFFTHGWELVNIVSWFVSLILLGYAITFFAKLTGRPIRLYLFATAVAALLLISHREVALSRHLIAYCLAALCGSVSRNQAIHTGWMAAVPLLILQGLNPQFLYGAISLLLLATALALPDLRLPGAAVVGGSIYEYFLLHGIFLDGATRLLRAHPAAAASLGIAAAALAAVSLRLLVARITPVCHAAASPAPGEAP